MSKFLGRVGVGLVVSFPVVCFLAGGVQDGFFLLILSVVCTAGISLVAWIPVWWVVGCGTLAVVGLIHEKANKVEKKNPVGESTPIPSRGDLALNAYIRHAMATGMDADVMVCRLHLNGWNLAEIQTARQNLISSPSKAQ